MKNIETSRPGLILIMDHTLALYQLKGLLDDWNSRSYSPLPLCGTERPHWKIEDIDEDGCIHIQSNQHNFTLDFMDNCLSCSHTDWLWQEFCTQDTASLKEIASAMSCEVGAKKVLAVPDAYYPAQIGRELYLEGLALTEISEEMNRVLGQPQSKWPPITSPEPEQYWFSLDLS